MMFELSSETLVPEDLKASLSDPGAGACVTFEGWVRNHNEGKTVERLEYEAYEELAVKEGGRIVAEAQSRFGLTSARCIHRVGTLAIGDLAVWVGVSATHRDEAFAACRYIIDEIKARVPIWKKEYYHDGDSGWVNCERCADHGHHGHHGAHHTVRKAPASRDEAAYYSRQTVLSELGFDGQRRLKNARVLIIGAGGLGCPAIQFLAAAGVGALGICDADRLDISNLHRQVLYRFEDVGQLKAELAGKRALELNPFIAVKAYPERFDTGNARRLFSEYDVVLDCTDNFETKYLLNDTAVATGKPLVQAGVYKFEGQIHVCDPDAGTGCLRCLWPEIPAEGCVGTCVEVGVLGMVPGLLGTLQATEAVKHIVGLPGVLRGAMLVVNLLNYHVHRMLFPKNPDCPVCGKRPQTIRREIQTPMSSENLDIDVTSLTPEQLAEYQIIDIREAAETAARPLTEYPCKEIPMSTFTPETLGAGVKYLLCCAHGVRSRNLATALRRSGLTDVYSLRGGVGGMG